ncbi:hypothetical protein NC652_014572 [Populus alba x Populus x berolinensis]|nr:hypothetical protein NC652_014572 [Populus alba x Populus x berolinensis]
MSCWQDITFARKETPVSHEIRAVLEKRWAHQLRGARRFSFDEITKSTNNFSEANHIGSGGYRMISLSLFSYPAMVVSFA